MKKYTVVAAALLTVATAMGQQLTRQDYARATGLLWQNLNNKKAFNLQVDMNWLADTTGGWYLLQSKNEKTFYKWDVSSRVSKKMFDHERLAKALGDSLKENFRSTELPFSTIRYTDPKHVDFVVKGRNYTLDLATYSITLKKEEPPRLFEETSPDGKWIAYTENYNLYIKSTETGAVKQLSKDGYKNFEFGSYYGWDDIITGENAERPRRFAVSWSPDSKWIQTSICDLRNGNKMYLLDWSVDTLYRPRLLSYYRGSPGDTTMVYMIPVFYNAETGEEMRKDELRGTHINSSFFRWSKEPGIVYGQKTYRGYKQVDLYRLNLGARTQELLYTESSSTNIDNFSYWMVEEQGKLLFTSEKDGWKQIYSLSLADRSVKPVTNGAYYVNEISNINRKESSILFTASGKEAGRNPYYQHVYRIGMDGKGLTLLTPENLSHEIRAAADGKYFADNMSAPDQPTRTVIRDGYTGTIIQEIATADINGLNMKFAETFTATGRDGVTTIYGAIWKPSNFDPSKKYPVIDQTYTGPHTNMFPRSFTMSLSRSNQALAELGFVVVTIDGLGSAGRSKAFHNFSYLQMGKNLADHVLAIRELGKKYTWADTTRVGIFGHSAGGYDAGHAMLEFPDFYKVAVASSADHDFRMEKAWWPEMYMGWPVVDSVYNAVSNITMAKNLKGKLLIVHGGIDENVNPSATFKLAEALVKADKEFDMLIFPGQRHGYTGKTADYFTKKRWNYFVEHLLGVKPIWDFELK